VFEHTGVRAHRVDGFHVVNCANVMLWAVLLAEHVSPDLSVYHVLQLGVVSEGVVDGGTGREDGDVLDAVVVDDDDVFVMTDAVDDDDAELEIPETQ